MEEDARETGPNYEQRHWEEEHLNAALLKFGAKDAKQKNKVTVIIFCQCIKFLRLSFMFCFIYY